MLKAISFRGVIVGAIVDVLGTNIWVLGVVGYLIIKHQLYALPSGEQIGELHHLYGDPAVGTLNAVVGFGFSIIGGYLAARIAGHHERLNGALSSFLCVAFSLYSMSSLYRLGDRRGRGKPNPRSSWWLSEAAADAKLIAYRALLRTGTVQVMQHTYEG
jgi:hypothetical protein